MMPRRTPPARLFHTFCTSVHGDISHPFNLRLDTPKLASLHHFLPIFTALESRYSALENRGSTSRVNATTPPLCLNTPAPPKVAGMTEQLLAHVLDTSARDESIRPQDDFYRHVNGTWLATHEIPAERPIDGTFHFLLDLSEERGKAIAEDAAANLLEDEDAELITTLWAAFMDEERIEADGLAPLTAAFDAVKDAKDRSELAKLSGKFSSFGLGTFFGVHVGTDLHDSNARMLDFYQAGIGLPDEAYYREDSYEQIRQDYLAHLAKLLALARLTPDAHDGAQILMDLETAFASHHRDSVSNRDPLLSDNQVTWAQLKEDAPGFDWQAWAEGIGLPVEEGTLVNISQPDFLTAGAHVWSQTPIEDLRLSMLTTLVDSNASLLPSAFVEENFDFFGRILSGTKELRPRWKRALSLIEAHAGESLGRIWVSRHFPPASKDRMDALVAGLLEAYGEAIGECTWMGEGTKAKALEKLSTFRPKIGYPPKWRDMSDLRLDPRATLLEHVVAARAFEIRREFKKLSEPVDRDEWFMTPQTVNAYYNPTLNEIVFPAAILQPPFFDPQADDAVNFGAIGAVIGHEIGHGFDDSGSRFDAHGNLENWWDEEDRSSFEALTSLLVDQYSALTPKDLEGENAPTVNGALTLGENIGDLAGLSIAWRAWVNALKAKGLTPQSAPVIDGLSGPKRFFYAWARGWRTATRPEFAAQMLAVDPHSPAEFRCNQILKNIDEFHAAFDVRKGDGMFLEEGERVHIW